MRRHMRRPGCAWRGRSARHHQDIAEEATDDAVLRDADEEGGGGEKKGGGSFRGGSRLTVDKNIEKYIYDMENNILTFSLNKCVANIYTLFNHLEKSKIYLGNSDYSKKILICLFPIIPNF